MPVYTGTVLAIGRNVKIKGKSGTYTGYELTYKDNDGATRIQTWHEKAVQFVDYKDVLDSLEVGDSIKLTKEKQGEYWNVTELAKVKPGEVEVDTFVANTATDADSSFRGKTIHFQNARTTAIAFAAMLLDNGLLTLPKTKITDKVEAVEEWVKHYTRVFYTQSRVEDPDSYLVDSDDDIPFETDQEEAA